MAKLNCHFIAMSGLQGYLPDTCQSFDHFKDALDFLVDLWSDYRGVKSSLKKYHYWERNENQYDLTYCEIVECDCDNPSIHNDYD